MPKKQPFNNAGINNAGIKGDCLHIIRIKGPGLPLTIREKPESTTDLIPSLSKGEEMMKKTFGIAVAVLFLFNINAYSSVLEPIDPNAFDFFGCSASIYGDYIVIGAFGDDYFDDEFESPTSFSGSVYIFHQGAAGWQQQQKLTVDTGEEELFRFGNAVDIYQDTIIVGAYGDPTQGSEAGSAFLFVNNEGNWTQQAKLLSSDGQAFDEFGLSVAVYGDYAIVGAPHNASTSTGGAAYIFRREGTTWVQQARLTPGDTASHDDFGVSVDIHGNLAVVGSGLEAAYVFIQNDGTWTEQAKLVASDAVPDEEQLFGRTSVAIHGTHIIAGACNNRGAAYFYEWDGSTWIEQQKVAVHGDLYAEEFGYKVAITDRYAVASWGWGLNSYVYEYQNGSWVLIKNLIDDTIGSDGGLGLYDNSVIWGNPNDRANGNQSGSAGIFSIVGEDDDVIGDDEGSQANNPTDSKYYGGKCFISTLYK